MVLDPSQAASDHTDFLFIISSLLLLQVLVADTTSSLRRLIDDITEDNWMYENVDLGYDGCQARR